MPCYETRLCSVQFQVSSQEHLIDALKADGLQVYVTGSGEISFIVEGYKRVKIANGVITVPKGSEYLIDRIKVAYSNQIVKVAATKYAWAMKSVKKKMNFLPAPRV